MLVNNGRETVARLLIGDFAPTLRPGVSRLGVGDSSAPVVPAQNKLQGVRTETAIIEDSYPRRVGNTIHLRARFGSLEANFPWNEWGIFTSPSETSMISRKVQSLGTKTADEVWELSVVCSITSP